MYIYIYVSTYMYRSLRLRTWGVGFMRNFLPSMWTSTGFHKHINFTNVGVHVCELYGLGSRATANISHMIAGHGFLVGNALGTMRNCRNDPPLCKR